MSATDSSFKYIEYTGDDAADVLVNMIVNITKLELEAGLEERPEHGRHAAPETDRVVGFSPNPPEVLPVEVEDDDA